MILAILLLGQAATLTLDGEAGYSGVVFSSAWNRVTADLANRGAPLEGVLQLVVKNRTSEGAIFSRRISAASGSRQRIPIDLFLSGLESQMELEVVDGQGEVRAQTPLRFTFAQDRGRRLVEVGRLGAAMAPSADDLDAVAVRTLPERLPDDFRLLRSVDAILMPEPFRLEPEQESAIRSWVEQGGRLIFSSGTSPAALSEGFWPELCPLGQPRTEAVSVPVGESEVTLPVVTGARKTGAPIYSLAGRPAAYRVSLGQGEVVFLAFPLDRARTEEAVPPGPLWRSAFGLPPLKEETPLGRTAELRHHFADTDTLLSGLSSAPPAAGLALAGGGLLVLGLYVLLIGPLDYLRLKRRGALRRGWISYGGIVALFTLISLSWAGVLRSHPTLLNHLVLADRQGVQVFSSLRAGPGGSYDFESKGILSPVPTFYGGSYAALGSAPPARVAGSSKMCFPAPALSTRTFVSCRESERTEFGVTCTWSDRAALRLRVRNDSPLELGSCLLVSQERVFAVGDLHAGEDRALSLEPKEGHAFGQWTENLRMPLEASNWFWGDLREFGKLDPALQPLFMTFYTAIRGTGPGRTRDRYHLAQKGIDLSQDLESGHWIFVGAFERDLSGVRLSESHRIRVRGLVRARVEEAAP